MYFYFRRLLFDVEEHNKNICDIWSLIFTTFFSWFYHRKKWLWQNPFFSNLISSVVYDFVNVYFYRLNPEKDLNWKNFTSQRWGTALEIFLISSKKDGVQHLNELDFSETFYSNSFETNSNEDGVPKIIYSKLMKVFILKMKKLHFSCWFKPKRIWGLKNS